ncbi:MAG TPA: fibronectin type III domain-containing protein, partial [Oscillospiraceae bacterium]|nr:fibronectin type III domain-containing protein [Oscillospiraceae bacterium]
MKKVKKSLSIALVLAILTTVMISPALALSIYDMSAQQWDSYWQEYISDSTSMYMAPGGNDSEMNFAWLGNTECENPTVYVKSPLIGSYDEFTGISVKIDNDNYSYQVTVYGLLPNRTYMYYYSANDYTS